MSFKLPKICPAKFKHVSDHVHVFHFNIKQRNVYVSTDKKVEAPLEKNSTDNVLSKSEMDMIEEVVEKARNNCGKRSRYNNYTPKERAKIGKYALKMEPR